MGTTDSDGTTPGDLDKQIEELVRQYREALAAGEVTDPAAWLERYPELRDVLSARLAAVTEEFLQTAPRAGPGPDPSITETQGLTVPEDVTPDRSEHVSAAASSSAPTEPSPHGAGIQVERSVGMRCPHCGQPLQLTVPAVDEITCSNCGHSFHCDTGQHVLSRKIKQPERIDRFAVTETLGRGGFGIVYKATDPRLSRTVAIKVPRAGYFATEREETRFIREAQSAAHLQHANIVRVHEIDRFRGIPFIVSEYIEGRTLRDILARQRLSYREIVEIVVQVSEALQYAHENHVIHRDVKPSNILIDHTGRAFVTDFGLARRDDVEVTVTIDGQVLGTPAYMSPEQAAGEMAAVDAQSDVYSLGVVLYRALCGVLPFHGSRRMMIQQVIHDDPKPLRSVNDTIPFDLETITLKAMAKEPHRRYSSAREFADDLRHWLRHEPIQARPVGRTEKIVRWCRRNPQVAALTAVIACLLIATTTVAIAWAKREITMRMRADVARQHAEELETTSRRQLVAMHLNEGAKALRQRNYMGAFSWFAAALDHDIPDADMLDVHRLRLGMTLAQCPVLTGMWATGNDATLAVTGPNRRRMLIASRAGAITVWDVDSHRQIGATLQQGSQVVCAALTPNGGIAATGGADGTVCIWNYETGKRLAQLRHTSAVIAASISKDGKLLATADMDHVARVWQLPSGTSVATLQHSLPNVARVAFSPDASKLLTLCTAIETEPALAQIWDLSTGKPVGDAVRHASYVWDMRYGSNGHFVISGGREQIVRVWDSTTGVVTMTTPRDEASVYRAFLTEDNRQAITVNEFGGISVWSVPSGQRLHAVSATPGVAVRDAKVCPSSLCIAVLYVDGTVRVRSLPTLEPIGPVIPSNGEIIAADFGHSDRILTTVSHDGIVRCWDLTGVISPGEFVANQTTFTSASYSVDGGRIVTTSRDGTAQLWDAVGGRPIGPAMQHDSAVMCAAFSPDDRILVTACADGSLHLWAPDSGTSLGGTMQHAGEVTCCRFGHTTDTLITAGLDGAVNVWSVAKQKLRFVVRHQAAIHRITVSPDGRWLATADQDGTAKITNMRTGKLTCEPLVHGKCVTACVFSNDGRRLATTSLDGTAKVWAVPTGKPITPDLAHTAGVRSAVFAKDGQMLFTTDQSGRTVAWDVNTPSAPRHIMRDDYPFVSIARLCCHDQVLITRASLGSSMESRIGGGHCQLWDTATYTPLSPPLQQPGPLTVLQLGNGGRRLLSGSSNGILRQWDLVNLDLPAAEVLRLADTLTGTTLDDSLQSRPIPAAQLVQLYQEMYSAYPYLFAVSNARKQLWKSSMASLPEQ